MKSRSRLPDVATWMLAATVLLTTLAWTNLSGLGISRYQLTYDDVALPRLVVAAVGLAGVWLVLCLMLVRGNVLLWDVIWLLLIGLFAWSVISAVTSGSVLVWLGQSERLEGVATILLYAGLYGAGLQLGRSPRYVRRLCAAFGLGAVTLSVQGLLQVIRLDRTSYVISGTESYLGSAFASLGNPNFLGGLLVLALPIVVALALTSRNRAVRAAWWLGSGTAGLCLVFTYSQGAWLAVVGVAAVWFYLRSRALSTVALAILTAILGVALIATVNVVGTRAGYRLFGGALSQISSERLLLFATAARAAGHRPLTGYGPDNFLAAFRANRSVAYAQHAGIDVTVNNAHNWFLQYAATLGIVGAILLVSAVLVGLWRVRPRSGASLTRDERLLTTAVWLGLLGYTVQMMLNAAVLASTVPFWILLGTMGAAAAQRASVSRALASALVAVGVVALALACYWSVRLVSADAAYLDSRVIFRGLQTGNATAEAERAQRLNPLSLKYARGVAQARAADAYAALEGSDASPTRIRSLYGRAADAFEHALRLAPSDYATLAWFAALQAATGRQLKDTALLAESKRTAADAAKSDRLHPEVGALARGDYSDSAIATAQAVPGLP